jgi:hypothetical protein
MTLILEKLNENPKCGCEGYFNQYKANLLLWLLPGGPPRVIYNKKWGYNPRGATAAPWDTMELNYDMVMLNEPCYIAGVILHEMGHMARKENSHPNDGIDKKCSFDCISTPRGRD